MYQKENFTKPRGIYEFDTATGKMRIAVPYNDRIWHTQCSPDGKKILFRTEVNNKDCLAIADTKSGDFKIFPGIKPMHFQWFDEQSFFGYIVPNVIGGDPNTYPLHEMYRWNLDGKIIEHLAGYGCHGAARADGKYFAGESWYGSDPTALRLYARGSRDSLHTIFSHNFVSPTWHNGRHHVNPSFSRDGIKIYTLTWANLVSGKKIYGAKAVEFVEAWAEKCEPSGNDVNDNKLLTSDPAEGGPSSNICFEKTTVEINISSSKPTSQAISLIRARMSDSI